MLQDEAIQTLKDELIPFVRVITPNIPEAEILLGEKIQTQEDLPLVIKDLSFDRSVSVLLKAGHLTNDELVDVFYNAETDEIIHLSSKRIKTQNTHGTGCTLSSAIAAYLAHGISLNDAIIKAKEYTCLLYTSKVWLSLLLCQGLPNTLPSRRQNSFRCYETPIYSDQDFAKQYKPF